MSGIIGRGKVDDNNSGILLIADRPLMFDHGNQQKKYSLAPATKPRWPANMLVISNEQTRSTGIT